MIFVILIVVGYLLGSIPTSVWVGKWFFGIDIREHGSGNAGATNTVRILGWKAGIPVFIIDGLKGFAAIELAYLSPIELHSNWFINFQLALGLTALVGHIFPLFACFKGGKGVATLLGIVLTLTTWPGLLVFGTFLIILLLFKYVSLGSIAAGFCYPFVVSFIYPSTPDALKIASIIMALALLFTHRKNIQRLLSGKELKADFLHKKKLSAGN